jgi:predicted metal-dependent hydrolase
MIGRMAGLLLPGLKTEDGRPVIVVHHSGERYGVEIRRSATARRLILRVRGATRDAVLTIPKRTSLADARSFAERQAAWIGARLRRLPETVALDEGAVFPMRGVPTLVVSQPDARGTVWLQPDCEHPEANQSLCVAGDTRHLPRRVVDFLRRECRRDLERDVAVAAERAHRNIPRITLRDTTTRWGSCTASGELNFSWRLILAPEFVLSYLAAHEVSHLVHMDHSPKFWALCRSLHHETDRAEAWLNAHGAELHRYRAAVSPAQRRRNVR